MATVLLVDQKRINGRFAILLCGDGGLFMAVTGIRTHLVAFDTSVVDLTADVADPVRVINESAIKGGEPISPVPWSMVGNLLNNLQKRHYPRGSDL